MQIRVDPWLLYVVKSQVVKPMPELTRESRPVGALRFLSGIQPRANAPWAIESRPFGAETVDFVAANCLPPQDGFRTRSNGPAGVTEVLTLEQIRQEGLEALRDRLGRAGMIRFLQLFESGSGNYAVERHQWVDSISLNDLRGLATPKPRRGKPRRKRQ